MNTIELLLSDLKDAEELSLGEYLACCPLHSWTRPTLHVEQLGDMVTVRCETGCDMSKAMKAIGWDGGDIVDLDQAGRLHRMNLNDEQFVLMKIKAKQILEEPITDMDMQRAKLALKRINYARGTQ